MKVCIFGAGAIGGYMGVKLAKAGADVSLVARGPHLAAMQEKGLTLIEEDESTTVPVTASDDPAALGVQDYVIVTLKAHSVPPVVSKMAPLIGPNTTIVSGVNGVPWWYFHKLEGAIGGYMGVKLAKAGADVSLVARGPHLAAMQENGLTLMEEGETTTVPVTASDDPAALGVQDYVIVTLKAHSVPPVVSKMAPLIGQDTTIVSGVNGVPWWYFHKLEGAHEGTRLDSVDPGNVQWDGFGPDRVLGCVVYPAAEVIEPGVIKHIEGNRFSLGEPDGSKSDRAQALSKILANAGLKAPVRPKLRDEIWVKLWGNLSFNPISALTHATLDVLCTDEGTRAVARNMMVEAQEIAERLGVKFPIDVDRRIAGGAAVGAHRTSMLQDLDQGRPMEIDALVASVQELGRVTGVPTPTIDTVLSLIRLRARTAGLYS